MAISTYISNSERKDGDPHLAAARQAELIAELTQNQQLLALKKQQLDAACGQMLAYASEREKLRDQFKAIRKQQGKIYNVDTQEVKARERKEYEDALSIWLGEKLDAVRISKEEETQRVFFQLDDECKTLEAKLQRIQTELASITPQLREQANKQFLDSFAQYAPEKLAEQKSTPLKALDGLVKSVRDFERRFPGANNNRDLINKIQADLLPLAVEQLIHAKADEIEELKKYDDAVSLAADVTHLPHPDENNAYKNLVFYLNRIAALLNPKNACRKILSDQDKEHIFYKLKNLEEHAKKILEQQPKLPPKSAPEQDHIDALTARADYIEALKAIAKAFALLPGKESLIKKCNDKMNALYAAIKLEDNSYELKIFQQSVWLAVEQNNLTKLKELMANPRFELDTPDSRDPVQAESGGNIIHRAVELGHEECLRAIIAWAYGKNISYYYFCFTSKKQNKFKVRETPAEIALRESKHSEKHLACLLFLMRANEHCRAVYTEMLKNICQHVDQYKHVIIYLVKQGYISLTPDLSGAIYFVFQYFKINELKFDRNHPQFSHAVECVVRTTARNDKRKNDFYNCLLADGTLKAELAYPKLTVKCQDRVIYESDKIEEELYITLVEICHLVEEFKRYEHYSRLFEVKPGKELCDDILSGHCSLESKEYGRTYLEFLASNTHEPAAKARKRLANQLCTNLPKEEYIKRAGNRLDQVIEVFNIIFKNDSYRDHQTGVTIPLPQFIKEQSDIATRLVFLRDQTKNYKDIILKIKDWKIPFNESQQKLLDSYSQNPELLKSIKLEILECKVENARIKDIKLCLDTNTALGYLFQKSPYRVEFEQAWKTFSAICLKQIQHNNRWHHDKLWLRKILLGQYQENFLDFLGQENSEPVKLARKNLLAELKEADCEYILKEKSTEVSFKSILDSLRTIYYDDKSMVSPEKTVLQFVLEKIKEAEAYQSKPKQVQAKTVPVLFRQAVPDEDTDADLFKGPARLKG